VKPENIQVMRDGSVKLADFGLGWNPDLALDEEWLGTPPFTAPEMFASSDRRVYTKECDIWSLGVTLHLLMVGQLPFEGPYEVLNAPTPPLPGGVDKCATLADLNRLMLRKAPERRPSASGVEGKIVAQNRLPRPA
jgi:serine/threonine protein kinase